MSKRRITHQQAARIQKNQQNRLKEQSINSDNTHEGLVIARLNRRIVLEDNEGQRLTASIRPHINAIVAGDRILYKKEGTENVVVISCFPRKTVLTREDNRGQSKPIAANISQIVIVVSPKPMLSWLLLDSYLIMAEYLGIEPLIVLNKIDLDETKLNEQLEKNYKSLGYPIVQTGLNFPAGDEGLTQLKITDIAKGYREFRPLISECKYRNCNHKDTPGCAIIKGVHEHRISALRYENYVRLSTQPPE